MRQGASLPASRRTQCSLNGKLKRDLPVFWKKYHLSNFPRVIYQLSSLVSATTSRAEGRAATERINDNPSASVVCCLYVRGQKGGADGADLYFLSALHTIVVSTAYDSYSAAGLLPAATLTPSTLWSVHSISLKRRILDYLDSMPPPIG